MGLWVRPSAQQPITGQFLGGDSAVCVWATAHTLKLVTQSPCPEQAVPWPATVSPLQGIFVTVTGAIKAFPNGARPGAREEFTDCTLAVFTALWRPR